MLFSRVPRLAVWFGFAFAAALAAAAYAYAMTPWGPWALTDSAAYVDAARSLASGMGPRVHTTEGELVLLVHHPPGYPTLLALGLRLAGGDWLAAARGLNVLALWLALTIIGWWLFEATHDLTFSLATTLALAVAPFTARAFTGVMSEAPFIALMVGWLYLLWRYALNRQPRLLWSAALLAGLGVLIRYAGLHAAIMLALAPLLWPSKPTLSQRLHQAMTAVGIFLTPFVLWMAWAKLMGRGSPGQFTSPTQWLPAGVDFLRQTADVFYQAVTPSSVAPPPGWTAIFWLGLLATTWGLWRLWQKRLRPSEPAFFLLVVAVLNGWAWFLFLAFMYVFIAPAPALDYRMYTPAMTMWLVAAFSALWLAAQRLRRERRALVWLALMGLLLVLTRFAPHNPTRAWLLQLHTTGKGYTQASWHQLAKQGALHVAAQLPPSVPLFSNAWEGVLLWTGREVQPIDYNRWRAAAAEDRLPTAPKYALWQESQGALLLVWIQREGQTTLVQSLRHSGAFLCYDGGLGSLYFPHPTEVCPAP
ncbi:MAG: glycosyltransferase family 39 protein [Chloroflexi bacterium]|nr:glycosyltransferase family 39 protein [Chloroflexota bacterium]